ncbi:DNA-binding protein [Pontibaca salina]|uniref:DNA-binding protein n=1 Tax=Pontibaca salina TaxID=2795731 RepID=A0A934HN05_9RHOB|nr:DNA-binding protein [Pontibaca salina]MBI6628357.1 DNA-binding protein [Pontibaca salina]
MAPLRVTPRLLSAPLAAEYLAVSVSTLRLLPIPRRALGSRRLYDARDLDAYADSLPYDEPKGENTCDDLFG